MPSQYAHVRPCMEFTENQMSNANSLLIPKDEVILKVQKL